jgi:RNA polymerase primary sigma factor
VTTFNNPALKQLTDQQVRFTPPQRRLEQLSRAERLLLEVEDGKQYPYQYVCFRVTEFRPDSYPDLLISGADLKHDLRQFIQEVAHSIDPRTLTAQPVESLAEPVLTLEELSKKLNVSTKTINRWRRRGLIGVPVLCNGRRQVGFLPSLLDLFLAANKDRVEKSARFSQMTEEEKEDILRRARRLSRVAGGTLTEVSRRIAKRLGRSPETVRYTIKNFDRRHPEQALFPAVTGPLDDEAKQIIYNSYRRGIAVDQLAKRFRRTRTSMYRVINEVRAQQLLGQPLEYIHHACFDDPSLEADILAPMPDAEEYEARKHTMSAPKDVPPELASCYDYPLLDKRQEPHLFRKMNFLKYRASKLREQLDPARARIQELKEIEDLQRQANDIKDLLIKANLRLVVSVAKKHLYKSDNIWELISDGNLSLMRAVEKFDFGRGFKFSTYATWAIMKNFARSIPEERNRRERYVTGHEDLFEIAPDNRSDEHEAEASAEMAAHQVNRLLQYLQPRERDIIRMRAGLDDHAKNMTLEEIGHELGITKERVRQLNVRAMKKLREIAQEQHLDML